MTVPEPWQAPGEFAELIEFEQLEQEFELDRLLYLLSLLTPKRRSRFVDVLRQRTRRFSVLLENLSQSHNFSAILRSCDCFGVQDVHMVDPRSVFEVSKDVALGAQKWLTTTTHRGPTATRDAVAALKSNGYRVYVASPHGESLPIHSVPVDKPIAIAFGTELAGVSDELESLADARLHIPMYGFTESFNVSVAAAICLSELTHRLRTTTDDWRLSNHERAELLLRWCRRSIRRVEEIEARVFSENCDTPHT